jgi:hypothetical protein
VADVNGELIHHPLLLVAGELAVLELELDWASHCRATSAASSLALLRFLPSYQKRALWTEP